MPLIPVCKRWRQDQAFKAILSYTASMRLAWATGGLISISKFNHFGFATRNQVTSPFCPNKGLALLAAGDKKTKPATAVSK